LFSLEYLLVKITVTYELLAQAERELTIQLLNKRQEKLSLRLL
jgi:hypothetical protein